MIKAVFCDLDGTLLHGECEMRISHTSIPVQNQDTLQKLIDSGVKFIPSSGRSHWDIDDIVSNLEHEYTISNNGTSVHKNGELITNNVIARSEVKKIIELLDASEMTYMANTVEATYFNNMHMLTPARKEFFKQYDIEQLDYATLDTHEYISLCALTNENWTDLHQLELKLNELLDTDYDILPSGMDCIDIVIRNVNKGNGAQIVMDLENWTWDEVACIGDNINDVDMLERTIHSFAMSHGRTKAKEASTHKIDHCAEAFEKILKINSI